MSSPPTSPSGTVLLLGGTGKVGSRIAPLLQEADVPCLVASRAGSAPAGLMGVRFDWEDESTWEPIFRTAIEAVYLIAPGLANQTEIMKKFIGLAREKGVSRFVLQSASSLEEDGPLMGKTHRYLRELGDEGKIGWAVLRPTWFQENFLEDHHRRSLKEESKIYSATGPGRIPWISAQDIASVGFHALISPQPANADLTVLGPESLTYADLAEIFTLILGRKIMYHELSESELAARHQRFGVPAEYASILAAMDTAIRNGAEDRTSDVVRSVTSREPRRFEDFVKANREAWS
ncbi:putative ergot alkaloid A [Hypoxylon crocopeplum]|nr:putative ergot alkaloid A [Hypoxylon crocopeplum]